MSASLLPYQEYWPLATAAVWWALSVYQVYRDRYRTWTERFFLGTCLFTGAYAFADVLFFTSPAPSAEIAAKVSFSVLTLAVACLLLFALVFYTRMRRIYFLAFLPAVALIALVWLNLVGAIEPLIGSQGPPWIGDWDRTTFAIWLVGSMGYAMLGAFFLVKTYREVAHQTTHLRGRLLGLLSSTLLAVALGGVTNAARGLFGFAFLPLFSTGLLLPGVVSVITLSPMTTERFSVAVRRWKATRYDIKAAFIIFTDGTLIGAKVRPGEKVIDQDLFGATLDVIQNFMHTSFPAFHGALSEIKLGQDILVVERGRYAYITLVLNGEVNDQLRRHMRDLLLNFERENEPVLSDWRGMPSEAIGADAMLSSLLEKT